jgi:hypothetical protein
MYDPILQIYHAQARFYDPDLKRFISPDPHWNAHNRIYGDSPVIMPNAGLLPDLLALRDSSNLYVYALNNPLKYTDSTGNFPNILDLTGALLPKTSILKHVISALPTAGMPAYEFTEWVIGIGSQSDDIGVKAVTSGLIAANTPSKMVDIVEKYYTNTLIMMLGQVNELDGTITISEFELQMAQVTGAGLTTYALGAGIQGTASIGSRYFNRVACPPTKPLSAPNIANAPIKQPAIKFDAQFFGRSNAKNLKPDPSASGAHTTFRRDPTTGNITHYETWKPNPQNPSGFDSAKSFHGTGNPHFNKVLGRDVNAPHVHDRLTPGGLREPLPWENPRWKL